MAARRSLASSANPFGEEESNPFGSSSGAAAFDAGAARVRLGSNPFADVSDDVPALTVSFVAALLHRRLSVPGASSSWSLCSTV